jgi:OOP family OmpA-OmpF porin
MKKHVKILTAMAIAGASSVAFAQQPVFPPLGTYPTPQWYFGGGAGQGHLNRSASDLTGLNNATLDDNDTTWTIRGGWRFSPFGAVEIGYYDFGRYKFHGTAFGNFGEVDGSAKAHSVGISLVGILPINQFDLYGRIGYAHSELKFNANGPLGGVANENQRQDEATYGVGGRWNVTPNWGVFVEWFKNDRIRVDSWVGGLDFRF